MRIQLGFIINLQDTYKMKLVMILIPIYLSVVNGLIFNNTKKYYNWVAIRFSSFMLIILLFSVLHEFFRHLVSGEVVILNLLDWIKFNTVHVKWEFLFDSLTHSMLLVVLVVSIFVHFYSMEYMGQDPRLVLFLSYLSLFTFFMVILVTSSNLLVTILGWEGVGLCSYLLISFWYTRIQANKSALKAIVMNRIGDFALLLAICTIFMTYRSISYTVLPYIVKNTTDISFFENTIYMRSLPTSFFLNIFGYDVKVINFIAFFLFIGAVGKSAQIGLHTWLPDAMEGPTPVSALIHAATMVTAGVFIIIRCSFFFENAPSILFIVCIVGAITCFFAASIGVFQYDIKKVIAYSTCSQLGYMVFACGTSNYIGGLYHLFTHAFFKALLFLCAGSVIHAISDEQNMKKMGGLIKMLPFTYSCMLIGSLALTGFPFLSGFYSKDFIIEVAYTTYTVQSIFAYWLGTMAAFFTSFYSIRLLVLTFYQKTNLYKSYIKVIHEAGFKITSVLFFLTVLSIFVGFFFKEIFLGFGNDFFSDAIVNNKNFFDLEMMPLIYKNIPVFFSLLGMFLGYFFYTFYDKFFSKNAINKFYKETYNTFLQKGYGGVQLPLFFKIYIFFNQKWHFDKLYNNFIGESFLKLGYHFTYKCLDKGFFELFGPTGIYNNLKFLSKYLLRLQSGFLTDYVFLILSGVTFILSICEIYFFNIF